MTTHRIWLLLHILLFVYWLGTDLGVLLLVRAAKRRSLSFAERAFALNMASAIGLVPRVCFALSFPVGLQVVHSGFKAVPAWLLVPAWILGLAWAALSVAAARREGKPPSPRLDRAHLVLQAVQFVLLGTVAVSSLLGAGPLPGGWVALKVLLLSAIFVLGFGVEHAFRPVIAAFARLVREGSRPEIEAPISAVIDAASRYVVTTYALLIAMALLGVMQPF